MEKNRNKKPQVIFFEGGEGAGKTTLIQSVSAVLAEQGVEHITTREPGGSPGSEQIRSLLKEGNADRFTPETHLLLHYAARLNHLDRTLIPAVTAGKWVLSDRFEISSYAYQVTAMGCPLELFALLHQQVVAKLYDLEAEFHYVYCDVDPKIGLSRVHRERLLTDNNRLVDDAYDSLGLSFHQSVRVGMNEAKAHIDLLFSHHTIDASQSPQAMLEATRKLFGI